MEWIPSAVSVINLATRRARLTRNSKLLDAVTVILGYSDLLRLEPQNSHYRHKVHQALTGLRDAGKHLPLPLAVHIEEIAAQI